MKTRFWADLRYWIVALYVAAVGRAAEAPWLSEIWAIPYWWFGLISVEKVAWAQAFGVVAALALSYIAWRGDNRRRSAERRGKATSARKKVLPVLKKWLDRLQQEDVGISTNHGEVAAFRANLKPPPAFHALMDTELDLDVELSELLQIEYLAGKVTKVQEKIRRAYSTPNPITGLPTMMAPNVTPVVVEAAEHVNTGRRMIIRQLTLITDLMETSLVTLNGKRAF